MAKSRRCEERKILASRARKQNAFFLGAWSKLKKKSGKASFVTEDSENGELVNENTPQLERLLKVCLPGMELIRSKLGEEKEERVHWRVD